MLTVLLEEGLRVSMVCRTIVRVRCFSCSPNMWEFACRSEGVGYFGSSSIVPRRVSRYSFGGEWFIECDHVGVESKDHISSGSQTVSWEFTITWKKILDLLRQIVNLEIHYCNRNVNNIANLLVKLHSPSFTVFQTILSPEVQDNYMTEQRTAEINTRTTQW